ncbi:hypothetical protein GDO78_006636 [Eleutherodactylus coqui]|uniref:Calponin n=1 Tax=Eleutherodactylus coqui TaxID=57060 RepID=A0A8J6FDR8_ELECQ|nr:hypothetical protein GDO78_006636 [Eleutherodactylus coqui]
MSAYGIKTVDLFEANDLFENGNMTQVQVSLLALAGMAKTKGLHSDVDIGVKYSERQERNFDENTKKAGQCVIGLQVGMTAPGTRRHIYDTKTGTEKCDNSSMSLQMGSNQGANQSGQIFGLGRQIYDPKYCPKGNPDDLPNQYAEEDHEYHYNQEQDL